MNNVSANGRSRNRPHRKLVEMQGMGFCEEYISKNYFEILGISGGADWRVGPRRSINRKRTNNEGRQFTEVVERN
jgi:hypothetical protein